MAHDAHMVHGRGYAAVLPRDMITWLNADLELRLQSRLHLLIMTFAHLR